MKTLECRIYEKAKKVNSILTKIGACILLLGGIAAAGMAVILTFAAVMGVIVGADGSLSPLAFMIVVDAAIVWLGSAIIEIYFKEMCEETKKDALEKEEETQHAYESGFDDGLKQGYVNTLTFRRKRNGRRD